MKYINNPYDLKTVILNIQEHLADFNLKPSYDESDDFLNITYFDLSYSILSQSTGASRCNDRLSYSLEINIIKDTMLECVDVQSLLVQKFNSNTLQRWGLVLEDIQGNSLGVSVKAGKSYNVYQIVIELHTE